MKGYVTILDCWHILSYVLLPLMDEITDIAAAVFHYQEGHKYYALATIGPILIPCIFVAGYSIYQGRNNACLEALKGFFFGLPGISQIVRLVLIFQEDEQNSIRMMKDMSLLEVIGESTPQFLLQVSYIMRFGNLDWQQLVCILISFLSIWRLVTAYSVSPKPAWPKKILATLWIALGTAPKLLACGFVVAYLRYYSFAVLAGNMLILAPIACWHRLGIWRYLKALLNFAVQDSAVSGLGIGVAFFQWFVVGLNMTATVLVTTLMQPFPVEESPEIQNLIDAIGAPLLCVTTGSGLLVLSLVVELISHKCLDKVWSGSVRKSSEYVAPV